MTQHKVFAFACAFFNNESLLERWFALSALLPLIIGGIVIGAAFGPAGVSAPPPFACVYFGGGMVATEVITRIAKRAIKEARPSAPYRPATSTEYGMPSSHSSSIFFCYLMFCYQARLKMITCVFLLPVAIFVAIGRVYLRYHTVSQIIVGALVGMTVASICHLLQHFAERIYTVMCARIWASGN